MPTRTTLLLGCLLLVPTAESTVAQEGKFRDLLQVKEAEIVDGDEELLRLKKQRYNAAVRALNIRLAFHRVGRSDIEAVLTSAKRVVRAEVAIATDRDSQVAALQRLVDITQIVEERTEQLVEAGIMDMVELELSRFHRYDAQVRLLEAQKTE